MQLQVVTEELQGVSRGYRGLPLVKRGKESYKGLQGVTEGYKLQRVTRGYRGLEVVILGYIGLPGVTGVTRGEKELQGITSGYRG